MKFNWQTWDASFTLLVPNTIKSTPSHCWSKIIKVQSKRSGVCEVTLGGFSHFCISANFHVGNYIDGIPQHQHTHRKNWDSRKAPQRIGRRLCRRR